MSVILFREVKNGDRSTASFRLNKEKKALILGQLEAAVEKLKEARHEIRQAVQLTLAMAEFGDDIADRYSCFG
ncbi:MAG: hypothetical protein ACXVNO_10675 [Bacteroidia bacterium]